MNDAQLAETRRWAERTAERGGSAELRAAARAILMLAEEVDRLRARLAETPAEAAPAPPAAPSQPLGPPAGPERPIPPGTADPKSSGVFDWKNDDDLAPARALAATEPDAGAGAGVTTPRLTQSPRSRPTLATVAGVAFAAAAARRRQLLVGALVIVAFTGAGTVALAGARRTLAPTPDVSGPPEGVHLGPAAAKKLIFTAGGDRRTLRKQQWRLDGIDVTARVRLAKGSLVLALPTLDDGNHRVDVEQHGFLGTSGKRRFDFVIDRRPPAYRLLRAAQAHQWQPLRLEGQLNEDARLLVDGRRVPVHERRFSVKLAPPLPTSVPLRATDVAGNSTHVRVRVQIVPRRPPAPVRGVHVTSYAWADRQLRKGILALIAKRRINAVELDLKDESGVIGFGADILLARKIGSVHGIYDLEKAVDQLHARGVRVIGRLVCFRDPILAAAAWKMGRRDMVIQTPRGDPYSGYGGFTNFSNPEVRRYQIAVAVAAARAGVDEILYDYVRRPDGPIPSMVFPGLHRPPQAAIVAFLRESRLALHRYGTFLGASVFGVAADRPEEVAQDVPRMAREVDYIAPMVYPSHWRPGEYGVPNPNAQPYEIVRRSLTAFRRDVKGTGARIVPWLQDFSLGLPYGPAEVRAEIEAAQDTGANEFLLWDPEATYTGEALEPDAPFAPPQRARMSDA